MVESVKLEKETHITLNPSGKIIKNDKQSFFIFVPFYIHCYYDGSAEVVGDIYVLNMNIVF